MEKYEDRPNKGHSILGIQNLIDIILLQLVSEILNLCYKISYTCTREHAHVGIYKRILLLYECKYMNAINTLQERASIECGRRFH